MSIAEDENLFVSGITSLARELNINTNVAYAFWREGKYTEEEKNQAINKAYHKFLKGVFKLKGQIITHHCPKCGDEVAGDENGLCQRCV